MTFAPRRARQHWRTPTPGCTVAPQVVTSREVTFSNSPLKGSSWGGAHLAAFVLANGSMSSCQSGEGKIRSSVIEAGLAQCAFAMRIFGDQHVAAAA